MACSSCVLISCGWPMGKGVAVGQTAVSPVSLGVTVHTYFLTLTPSVAVK